MAKRYSVSIEWTEVHNQGPAYPPTTQTQSYSSIAAAIRDVVRRSEFRRGGYMDESVRITVRRVA